MKAMLALIALLTLSVVAFGQESTSTPKPAPAATAADKFSAEVIPRNSKVFIGTFVAEGEKDTGFATYLAAAIRKKNVPVILVINLADADFEISGSADKKGAGWAKKIFLGSFNPTTSASIAVVNTKTGVVAYADASHRESAARGMRSSAEKLAKYLKKKIEDDEKKAAKLSK
jgi:hypothetical protein